MDATGRLREPQGAGFPEKRPVGGRDQMFSLLSGEVCHLECLEIVVDLGGISFYEQILFFKN